MTRKPLFTIVTPVYNAAQTLHRCSNSILGQSFVEWEWLLVDDGSVDNSWEYMEGLAQEDKRIRVFREENMGPSVARNVGLDNAEGEYVLFMDADDYYPEKNVLSCLADTIERYSEVDVIFFPGNVVQPDGTICPTYYNNYVYDKGCSCIEEYCCKRLSIVFGAIYVQCVRRLLITQSKISFKSSIVYGEDRLFVMNCFLKAKKTVVISNPLYNYVVTKDSLMHDAVRLKRQAKDVITVALEIEKLLWGCSIEMPHLRKYIHGLYVQHVDELRRNEIDWRFVFRNASTLRLKTKDVLLFLGINLY